jgi:hypothetical protein
MKKEMVEGKQTRAWLHAVAGALTLIALALTNYNAFYGNVKQYEWCREIMLSAFHHGDWFFWVSAMLMVSYYVFLLLGIVKLNRAFLAIFGVLHIISVLFTWSMGDLFGATIQLDGNLLFFALMAFSCYALSVWAPTRMNRQG